MRMVLAGIALVLAWLVVIGGMTWLAEGNSFFLYRYFAPQYADVQRKVFEQTAPYNEGMMQDLRRMQEEYVQADTAHKPALADLILHNYASYDENRMPPDLRAFYDQLKQCIALGDGCVNGAPK